MIRAILILGAFSASSAYATAPTVGDAATCLANCGNKKSELNQTQTALLSELENLCRRAVGLPGCPKPQSGGQRVSGLLPLSDYFCISAVANLKAQRGFGSMTDCLKNPGRYRSYGSPFNVGQDSQPATQQQATLLSDEGTASAR